MTKVKKTSEQIANGDDKFVITKEQVKDEIKKTQEENQRLIDIGNDVVFKHKLIMTLVDQVLRANNKLHDDLLALKLYNKFEKELDDK